MALFGCHPYTWWSIHLSLSLEKPAVEACLACFTKAVSAQNKDPGCPAGEHQTTGGYCTHSLLDGCWSQSWTKRAYIVYSCRVS
jgi:hypothetical protein